MVFGPPTCLIVRDPDCIVEELSPPCTIQHQLEPGKWLEPGRPFLAACSLSACPVRECRGSGGGGRGRRAGPRWRACASKHREASTWQSCITAMSRWHQGTAAGIAPVTKRVWRGAHSSLRVGSEEATQRARRHWQGQHDIRMCPGRRGCHLVPQRSPAGRPSMASNPLCSHCSQGSHLFRTPMS